MADKYYSGKNGKVTLGTSSPVVIPVQNWKASHSIQELETTSTTSGGKYEVQGGIEKLEGSFEAHWEVDSAKQPFASGGYGFVAGATLAHLKLFISSGSGGPVLDMTGGFIKSVECELDVNNVVKYTVSFVSNGDFTLPS